MKERYIVTSKEEGMALREFILLQGISTKALSRIKRDGKIECNKEEKTVRYQVKEQDIIDIIFPLEDSYIEANDIPFTIYYEDDYYMIIDKPSSLPCIPSKRYPTHTLANAIMYYYQKQGIKATVHLVNRLDKDTSGLLVVAKHSLGHHALSKEIKQVERIYYCLVSGILEGEGIIDAPIGKSLDSIKRVIDNRGKKAITRYKTLQHIDNTTLIECRLETGRTHQIRVHLESLGHPLIGDTLYGNTKGTFYLESIKVSFVHPFTKEYIEIHK
jgi:23S rRNA pseudouridine1911/1915/1917 synthase